MNPPSSAITIPGPASARKGPRGFTLIELTIVIALIGILTAMGVYLYQGMMNKARMTQAKTVLGHLVRTEAIYYANYDRYTDDVSMLDFNPVRYPFYDVSVVLDNDARGFTGYARGVGVMTGDLWFCTHLVSPTQDNTSPFRY